MKEEEDHFIAYGYSHRRLQRLFLMYTRIPLGGYIRRRGLNRVALPLRLSQRSLQDIVPNTGFDSLQPMNRDFKKNTGLTQKNIATESFCDLIDGQGVNI